MSDIKKSGSLWWGWDWNTAIEKHFKTVDCWFEEIHTYKNPDTLMDDATVFSHYLMCAWGNHRKRCQNTIPSKYNAKIESYKPTDKIVKKVI
jgi:hypothetical protein